MNSIPGGSRPPGSTPAIGLEGIVWPAQRPDPAAERPVERPRPLDLPAFDAPGLERRLDGPAAERELPLEFTGRGGDYFRIWIVNLLLTVVTLGLYHPWAKARKLRYFYGNTRLDGHAFDFHGQPRRMLRGLLLVGALFAAYSLAGQFSDEAGLLALLILAAVWPALLQAGWSFRIGQTSWRGLRFQFTGSVRDAYTALRPALVAAVLVAALPLAAQAVEETMPLASTALNVAFGISLLGTVLLLPYFFWRLKAWVHDSFRYGSLVSRLEADWVAVYGVALRTLGLALLMAAIGAAVVAGIGFVTGAFSGGDARGPGLFFFAAMLAGAAFYAVMLLVVQPYAAVRMQNLLWSATRARGLRIDSDVSVREVISLSLRNGLMIVLTLGLFWPFAVVDMTRLRLSGVSVRTRLDFDALSDRRRDRSQDAAGDAAADLAGFDIGL